MDGRPICEETLEVFTHCSPVCEHWADPRSEYSIHPYPQAEEQPCMAESQQKELVLISPNTKVT